MPRSSGRRPIRRAQCWPGPLECAEPAVRVPFVEIPDGDVGFVPEGDDIEEADPDSSEVVIHTGKVAVLAKISRE
jgi:hypothetical protein